MQLTAETKPYMLRKELRLPREHCRLHLTHNLREACVGKPGYSIGISWAFTDTPPEFSFEYDPSVAHLCYSPAQGTYFFMSFVPSKVAGNPPQYLEIRRVLPDKPAETVRLRRPKGSTEIPTDEILATLQPELQLT